MTIELIVSLGAAVFGSSVITAIVTGYFNKSTRLAAAKQTEAAAKSDLADSTLKWAESLAHRVDMLEAKLDGLQKENLQLQLTITAVKTELQLYKEGRVAPTPITAPVTAL